MDSTQNGPTPAPQSGTYTVGEESPPVHVPGRTASRGLDYSGYLGAIDATPQFAAVVTILDRRYEEAITEALRAIDTGGRGFVFILGGDQ